MGTIDHRAIEARDPDTGRGSERRHHASRVLRFRRGGRKRGIDGGDLLRVDGELAAEAVAAGTSELTLPSGRVTKVGVHAIHGLNTERRGGGGDTWAPQFAPGAQGAR